MTKRCSTLPTVSEAAFNQEMDSKENSKLAPVTSWFDKPDKYLTRRRFDIQIRSETVQEFTKGRKFDRVLDIGCGDGSLSIPLLSTCRKLTLLDVSNSMLAIARSRISENRVMDVDLRNSDFNTANLDDDSYDLILCVGVLAHVDSPSNVIAQMARIAKPGALLILEFTDSFHPWGIPDTIYRWILKMFRPMPFEVNRLRHRDINALCREKGLVPINRYRYGIPPAGTHWFANQARMYSLTRYLFGQSNDNRNGWMGNEFIYCLEKH